MQERTAFLPQMLRFIAALWAAMKYILHLKYTIARHTHKYTYMLTSIWIRVHVNKTTSAAKQICSAMANDNWEIEHLKIYVHTWTHTLICMCTKHTKVKKKTKICAQLLTHFPLPRFWRLTFWTSSLWVQRINRPAYSQSIFTHGYTRISTM